MKHNLPRRMGALLLALALVLPMAVTTAWADDPDTPPAGSEIVISPSTLNLNVGDQGMFQVTLPADIADADIVWSYSKYGVIIVNPDSGGYTAIAAGETDVIVTAGGKSASCKVTVTDPNAFSVKLNRETARLQVNETLQLSADVVAPNNTYTITWTSRNPYVATVDQNTGLVTAKTQGTAAIVATVTAKNTSGAAMTPITATCEVQVYDPFVTVQSLTVSPTALTLSTGGTANLTATIQPYAAQSTPIHWDSDTPDVAEVDQTGKVTAKSSGTATITAIAGDKQASCAVTVMTAATGIEFTPSSNIQNRPGDGPYTQFNANDGRTRLVYVDVRPANTNTYVVWSSSDASIVTAAGNSSNSSRGELTVGSNPRPAGQATVTATVYDGATRQPVKGADGQPLAAELDVVVSGIALGESTMTMYVGEAKPLSVANYFGDAAGTGNVDWTSSDSSIASADGSSGGATVNAWTKGTATITITKGNYSARCVVNVVEDQGAIVNAGSAAAGNAIRLNNIAGQLNSIAYQRTGANMEYISSIFISPNQGVVYNTYTSEANTGAGVSMAERYYVNRTTPAAECVNALSFVPNKEFSGEARISYIGRANGQDVSGVITVNVTGMGQNGSDVTYTANAAPVTFVASDFNTICNSKQGRALNYVTFTPPDASRGTLYENYTNATHPGQKVVGTTRYNRSGSPNLNSVTFVPAEGYSGQVRIAYRAVDTSGAGYSGYVTINVTKADTTSDPADIYYTAPQDGWATFRAQDFANASLRTIGETLSHVRFELPPSSDGTLFYNYRGFSDYDSDIASTTNYYQSGTPALSRVTFVPATTTSGQAVINYTGYSTRGSTFTGRVFVSEGSGSANQPGTGTGTTPTYDYTVNSGSAVTLSAYNFNSACRAATGADLSYIRFTTLPASGQGTLRYRNTSGTTYNVVNTATQFYRTGSSATTPLIGTISFLANAGYTGVVRLPYTGWSTSGATYTGEVTIQVTPNTIVYTGTAANPMRLSSARVRTACGDTFTNQLSYIEFTSLPSSSAGRLYLNYSGYGTGTQAGTGVRYYASGSPSIDQLSFVPRGRFTGDATATYTAYSTSGERMTGQITFRVSAATGSSYFTDMGSHTWAAPSVDYLYQHQVTNGMTATTFGPNLRIRRADFLLMLHRIFHFTGGSASNTGFADVPANAYYAQAVSAAKRMGIVSGDGVNFMPSSQVTRQDAMVMVKNAMEASGRLQTTASTAVLNNFPDGASVSGYAREAVSTLVQMGAVNGSNGMLNPRAPITRAEAAVILHFVMTV